jgi:hypothetical protein
MDQNRGKPPPAHDMKPDQIFSGIARLQNLQDEHEGTAALMDILRPRFDALRTRHQDGTAPRAITALNLFQTPEALAARMADLAELSDGQRLLEPSAGLGRILRACEAFSGIAEHIETIQAGTFRAEGTGVETLLLKIRK